MERRFFSGTTVEQAVLAAARHFEIDPERVAYAQRDKRHGFLKIRRRVVIEVDPQEPEKKEVAPTAPADRGPSAAPQAPPYRAPAHRAPAEAGYSEEPADEEIDAEEADAEEIDLPHAETAEEAIDLAMELLAALAGLELTWSVSEGDDAYEVELSGPDSDVATEDDGQFLSCAEHLIPRLVRGMYGETVACRVDCDSFRASHEEELQRLAERVAAEVLAEGESQLLDPMSPSDRRIIHISLADRPGIETESEGNGYFKRVAIIPTS